MNTAPRDACQSGANPRRGRVLGWAVIGLLVVAGGWEIARLQRPPPPPLTPGAAVAPPRWRQELDAAQLLETTLLMAPPTDGAEMIRRADALTETYRRLATTYPDRAAVQKAAGEYAWRHERPGDALALLHQAEALDPADAETADTLSSVDIQLGRTREAATELQKAVRLAPGVPEYHFALATVLFLFRHDLLASPALPDESAVLTRALAEYRQAADLAPRDLRYAQAYAETFYNLPRPDWEAARTAWQTVLTLSGTDTDFACSHLARVSLRMRQPAQTEVYLAMIHDPRFAELKANLHKQAADLPPAWPTDY